MFDGANEKNNDTMRDIESLIEGFGEGFYAVDRDWRVILFNAEASRHFGIAPQDAIGKLLWELFPSAVDSRLGRQFKAVMEERAAYASETESALFPGRWLRYRLFPFKDGIGVVFRNITELRQAERELRASELRYRALVENANDLVLTLSLDLVITSANPAAERILGFAPSEIIGTPLARYVPSEQIALHREMLARKLAGEHSTVYELKAIDRLGRMRTLEANSRLSRDADGAPREIHAIVRDVTEQRSSEFRVRQSEERLRLAVLAARLGLFEIDWQAQRRFWSDELLAILGMPADHDVGQDHLLLESLLPAAHLTRLREKLAGSKRGEKNGEFEDEHLIVRSDGSEAWIHIWAKTYLNPDTKSPVRTLGAVMDVTDRKLAEEANALLASVVRSSNDAIVSADGLKRIRTWNQGAQDLYGYTPAEVVGGPLSLLEPDDASGEINRIADIVLRGDNVSFEALRRHKDGQAIAVQISSSPMRSPDGAIIGTCAVHRDIRDRKRHEEHITFTMHELSHRTKNILAVVQAIARQIGNTSASIEQLQERLTSSIQGLSFSHDLLTEQEWKGAALDRLIELQLSPFGFNGSKRISTSGPPIFLKPSAVQLIGLALHELATNAVKHGAFSNADGSVVIKWVRTEAGSTLLSWTETGGPTVRPPTRRGFGHTVLERMAKSLGGNTRYEWRAEGVFWSIEIKPEHAWLAAPDQADAANAWRSDARDHFFC